MCLGVTTKTEQWGGLGPLGLSRHEKKIRISLEMNDAKMMRKEMLVKVNAVFLAVLLRYLEILSLILVPETGWRDVAYGFFQSLQQIPRLLPSRSLALRQL